MDWLDFLIATLCNATVIGGLGYIAKTKIEEKIRHNETVFKARLTAMQREWEIRFAPFHQRRVEVLASLYGEFVSLGLTLDDMIERYDLIMDARDAEQPDLDWFKKAYGDMADEIRAFQQQRKACLQAFAMAAPFLSDDLRRDLGAAQGHIHHAQNKFTFAYLRLTRLREDVMVEQAFMETLGQRVLAMVREEIGSAAPSQLQSRHTEAVSP